MKLDKIKFARLIAYIQDLKEQTQVLETYQIEYIDELTEINVEPVKINQVPYGEIDNLLFQIGHADGFIPAIKAYRALTGQGLKEAKEAIERYRVISKFRNETPIRNDATLGDILGKATGK